MNKSYKNLFLEKRKGVLLECLRSHILDISLQNNYYLCNTYKCKHGKKISLSLLTCVTPINLLGL